MVQEYINDVHAGPARTFLSDLPENSVHFVMFSPPYWALRNYETDVELETLWGGSSDCAHSWSETIPGNPRGGSGTPNNKHNRGESYGRNEPRGCVCTSCGAWKGQLGLEPSPELYAANIARICRELRRVLRPDGSMWINIGDTYCTQNTRHEIVETDGEYKVEQIPTEGDKCKLLLPQRVAHTLIADGWILRNDGVWKKTNPMPEPVEDRLSTTFEYVFHFVQSENYYYDLDSIRDPYETITDEAIKRASQSDGQNVTGKNPGDIFPVATGSSEQSHFAVFPPELVQSPLNATCPPRVCSDCGTPYKRVVEEKQRPDIRDRNKTKIDNTNETNWNNNRGSWAGTPTERLTQGWEQQCDCSTNEYQPGIVLDPMCGRGTTCRVAANTNRRFIGSDINPDYIEIAQEYVPDTIQRTLTEYTSD